MKIYNRAALIITAAALCMGAASCAGEGSKQILPEQVNEKYGNTGSISAKARVDAVNADGNEFSFVLQYDKNASAEQVKVVEPEEISDIVINFSGGQMLISENGASLSDGLDNSLKYTAASVLPQIFKTLKDDMITDSCGENIEDVSCTAFSYNEKTDDREYIKRIWLGNADMLPKKAEIYEGGSRIIVCEFLSAEIT